MKLWRIYRVLYQESWNSKQMTANVYAGITEKVRISEQINICFVMEEKLPVTIFIPIADLPPFRICLMILSGIQRFIISMMFMIHGTANGRKGSS